MADAWKNHGSQINGVEVSTNGVEVSYFPFFYFFVSSENGNNGVEVSTNETK
jgi:hypothetical protein